MAKQRADFFLPLALIYLVLPNLLFLGTWVKPCLGLPALVVVGAATGWFLWTSPSSSSRLALTRPTWVGVVVLAFLWTLLTGVGGWVPQSMDYLKHNLLFHDLVQQPWPVTYQLPETGAHYLCYGLGYYLLPALGGAIVGGGSLPFLTFLWTWLGVGLVFYWVATFAGKPAQTLFIVLGFAATGILWSSLKQVGVPGLCTPGNWDLNITQLGLKFNFNDSFTRFQYQPQHALPGWLGAAVLYELLWVRQNPRGAFLAWAACLLWSPLTCLGLLLLPLAALRRLRWQNYFEPVNLLGGGLLLVIVGIYLQGHLQVADAGPIWRLAAGTGWIFYYLLFLLLELSPLFCLLLLDRQQPLPGPLRPLLYVSALLLLLLPLYRLGFASDIRLQASGPALLFAALAASHYLQSPGFTLKRPRFLLLVMALLLGAVLPLTRPWTNLLLNRQDFSYAHTAQTLGFRNLAEMRDPQFNSGALYLGRPDSPAARWLLRPPATHPPAP